MAVGEGQAASMIVDQAEQAEGTLIAMCTHGRSGISRWVLGSVAEKVLNATNNPLLVIRARPLESDSPDAVSTHSERWATTVTIKAVTVPLDGSSVSEQILSHAKSIAKSLDVPVTLVGVATPDSSEAEVAGYLDTAANTLRQDGVSSNETQLLHGDPADAILDMLQQSPDCLVAMTTRGRSGVKRWTMGSVTDRVVRYSGAPVLVVRGV